MYLLSAETIKPNTIHQMDALSLLGGMADKSVDAIITDLPYGTTACSWDAIIPFEPMWAGVKRVLKPRGVFVTTASQPFTSKLVMSNPTWFKYSWVWIKSIAGDIFNAKNKPLKQHEDVLIFSDGTTANRSDNQMPYYPQGLIKIGNGRKHTNFVKERAFFSPRPSHKAEYLQEYENYPTSVLSFDNDIGYHPTQKPVALYRYLIETYTRPGELVVDFCCGSGTSAVAAFQAGRRFIAGDTSAEYVAITKRRLQTTTQDMFALSA